MTAANAVAPTQCAMSQHRQIPGLGIIHKSVYFAWLSMCYSSHGETTPLAINRVGMPRYVLTIASVHNMLMNTDQDDDYL